VQTILEVDVRRADKVIDQRVLRAMCGRDMCDMNALNTTHTTESAHLVHDVDAQYGVARHDSIGKLKTLVEICIFVASHSTQGIRRTHAHAHVPGRSVFCCTASAALDCVLSPSLT
jgi:hypothetical protein